MTLDRVLAAITETDPAVCSPPILLHSHLPCPASEPKNYVTLAEKPPTTELARPARNAGFLRSFRRDVFGFVSISKPLFPSPGRRRRRRRIPSWILCEINPRIPSARARFLRHFGRVLCVTSIYYFLHRTKSTFFNL